MDKMIVVGNDIYDEFIRDNGYYVDKTELIYDLAAKTRNKVTLFTRPRRFGKTLTLSSREKVLLQCHRFLELILQGLWAFNTECFVCIFHFFVWLSGYNHIVIDDSVLLMEVHKY